MNAPVTKLNGMDTDTSRCVCDHLAIACDLLAEYVASNQEERPPGFDSVSEAMGALYKLRAEIGFFGGQVVSDLVEPVAESEAS